MITERYGTPANQLRAYLHYQPSFYHLHVHFTHVKQIAAGILVGRAHMLDDVIDNIANIHPHYYQKRTIMFVIKETEPLLDKFKESKKLETL